MSAEVALKQPLISPPGDSRRYYDLYKYSPTPAAYSYNNNEPLAGAPPCTSHVSPPPPRRPPPPLTIPPHIPINRCSGKRPPLSSIACATHDHVRLRYLTKDDYEHVKRVCAIVFPIEYPDYWYEEITTNSALYALAAVDARHDSIVGLMVAEQKCMAQCNSEDGAILSPDFSPLTTRVSYILSVGVLTPYRRQGIATRLLDEYMASVVMARSESEEYSLPPIRCVYLHVLHSNTHAMHFYERRQFQLHVRLRDYYRIGARGEDGLTYVLYVNGGHPAWTIKRAALKCATVLCSPIKLIVQSFVAVCQRLHRMIAV